MLLSKKELSVLGSYLKYYSIFQLIFVIFVILFSSVGAFFHFLLDHEISIVESWLHNNQWEILIISKLISLFLINKWFKVRLYQFKNFRTLMKESLSWPESKAIVISVFMLISLIASHRPVFVDQNTGHWYYLFISYFGIMFFLGIEFVLLGYLEDILSLSSRPSKLYLGLSYALIFTFAFKISIPDYYGMVSYLFLCYSSLILLSGDKFKNWSNVLSFLVLFVAPMASLFGLDPIWGDDFSPLRLGHKPNFAFLAVIWMISFFYYRYREILILSIRKLIR